MRVILYSFTIVLASVLTSGSLVAGTNGILEGRTIDKQTHDGIVGVNVTIDGMHLGGTTDSEGYYQINNVRAGVYDVRFSILGYQRIIMKQVTIIPDLRTRLNMELNASVIELNAVEIRTEQPLIQRDQAATEFSIGETKIENLPVSTIQEVVALQPGTTLEGNVCGGKTAEVVYLVDGIQLQDVIGGGLGATLPKSSITALTIYTGGFEAEYGNALSGVINVVTKTGSDRHTIGVRLERDNWLPLEWNEQQDREMELELTASGPLLPRQLSYFTAHTASFSDSRWWQDFREFFPSSISKNYSGLGKLEYEMSPSMKLNLQGIYSLHSWRDYEYSWRYNLDGLPARSRNSYRLTAGISQTLSDHSFYTVSMSEFLLKSRIGEGDKNDLSLQPYEYDFFLRYIIAGERNWWANTRQTITTLKGDYTNQIGKEHFFKTGIELNLYDIYSDLVKYEPQKTYFGKPIADAPMLNYSNTYSYFPRSGSAFIQDKIQFEHDGSNLSLGIRWDFFDPRAERPIVEYIALNSSHDFKQQVTGTTRARFKQQFSPRVALAAPVGPLSFFFLNFGYYFQFPLFDYLYSGINPVQLREGVKNVLTGNPDLEPERTITWEIGFKNGITNNIVWSVTYFQKHTENQVDAKTLVPFDSKYAGDYGFASYVNNAEALARGIEFVVSKEYDERLSGSASYAYMTTEGLSEYVDQQINFAQWGFPVAPTTFPLSWDQRHTFKANIESKLPLGIQSNLILLYNSARPYTYYPTRDGFKPANPTQQFVPNNARMQNVFFLNLKLSKQFMLNEFPKSTLTIYADGRNILNTENVKWIDSNGRIGGELNDPGAYYDPRRVRIGARVEF
ncbi:MAG: TonB-dependent receptor [Ignavibacteriae bacterium]|nr:TonB-dependent receptor [Ignavibacteria bacterium]MBI3365114.1 TonB-dependent receptor [Ignavibacteriota bacterium]